MQRKQIERIQQEALQKILADGVVTEVSSDDAMGTIEEILSDPRRQGNYDMYTKVWRQDRNRDRSTFMLNAS